MRLLSLTISAGVHIAAVLAAVISLPWLKKDFDIPPPVMVEFIEIGKVTETTRVADPVPKVEKPEEKKEEPPPPAPKNTAKEAAPPAPKKPEPAPPKKEEPKKESKPEVDPIAKPDKKPPPKKEEPKKETKPKEPDRDFSSLLKNLADPKPTPPSPQQKQPDMGLDTAQPVQGARAPLGQKMTMREEDALRQQLEGCWNVPFGAKDAQDLNVEIFMVINPDRTLRDARIVDMARYNRDTFFRAAADSAMRAVRSPLCSPFMVPADKYDVWKNTTVNFNPREMF